MYCKGEVTFRSVPCYEEEKSNLCKLSQYGCFRVHTYIKEMIEQYSELICVQGTGVGCNSTG